MTKSGPFIESAEARLHEKRAHIRRKLSPMAYVELGQDNGGILLNLSEGGFAVQSALTLTSREWSELRFQIPECRGWLTAHGQIVWMSDSKKEAGIQFTELPGEARREIYKWVAAEGEAPKVAGRFPIRATENREPRKEILETSYGGGGGAPEPAIAHTPPTHAAAPNNGRASGMQTGGVGVAVAEPSAQDFRFGDYSMFAAEPEKEGVWAEPVRRRRGWGAAALLGILVAVLFFVLGASIGRKSIDQWIADFGDRAMPTEAPKVTAPGPPELQKAVTSSEEQAGTESDGGGQANAEESGSTSSGTAASSKASKGASDETKETDGGVHAGVDSGRSGASTVENGIGAAGNERRPRRPSDATVFRNEAEPGAGTEHAILVNAPRPGNRPFYVNLPGEAISASAAIAVSARRTLEILPSATGGPERVIIGKLISHSEPFYPVEARKQHIEGSVELRARVGRTGQIIGVTPVSGPGLLTSAAATAVREWRYEPTYVDGDPAETLADITIVFRLP